MRLLVLAPLVALAVLAAGCGGSSSPHVATVATTTPSTTTTPQNGLVAFSSCMRAHGLPNFPDPQHFAQGSVKLTIHAYGPNDPQVQAAINHCRQLLPRNAGSGSQQTPAQQHKQLEDALSFARCMRSHGVTHFPDPDAQGQLSVAMVQAAGIDIHSPTVLHVVQECLPASHGALTPAKVAEALHDAGG